MKEQDEEFAFIARRARPRPPVRMPASPLWGLLAWLAVMGALVGLVYLGFVAWERTAPGEVIVPDVAGVQLDAARTILANKQLVAEVGAYRPSDTVPKEHVLRSDPKPGQVVKQGRVVRLVVSTGKEWVTVPNLREMPAEKAAALCEEAGLRATRRAYRFDAAPQGYVIDQTPEPRARARVGSEVTLVVSRGPESKIAFEPGHKYADVTVSLPPGGERRHVEILVLDDNGSNAVYSAWHEPGSSFVERVGGAGDNVEVRVYVDGALVKQLALP